MIGAAAGKLAGKSSYIRVRFWPFQGRAPCTYRDEKVTSKILELGCGPNKKFADSTALDIHAYPGVDVVHNLNETPWPVAADAFDTVHAWHVIEHLPNLFGFFSEVHRVATHGALVHLETPHYSSRNSWNDPTHVHHLSAGFMQPMLAGGYLAAQTGVFEIVSRKVTFGSVFHSWLGRLMVALFGIDKWEKHYAFRMPASSVRLVVRVVK